ncbi:hypothetical protein K1T71_011023 [Dendrolimus kikuchii]|uniref:Uncharacterized protein n=1 Tax=Dendrolimus kikuchii TaxID=765133 RepID=A0ACC1CR52_9NEOP|nr:hypothetical protein K1T71_011023 [Dendrolimus kikuchii]
MQCLYFYLDVKCNNGDTGLTPDARSCGCRRPSCAAWGQRSASTATCVCCSRRPPYFRCSNYNRMASRAVLSSGPGGKDVVIIASREELAAPSRVTLPEPEPAPGLILPDGSINWGCPCLGGMATGPCGTPFRDAFSCFHYSEAEPKGSDCYEKFSLMQDCMARYPDLYGKDDDDELAQAMEEAQAAADAPTAPPDTPKS